MLFYMIQDIYAKFKEYHEDEVTVISMKASSLMAAEIKAQSQYDIVFPRVSVSCPPPITLTIPILLTTPLSLTTPTHHAIKLTS